MKTIQDLINEYYENALDDMDYLGYQVIIYRQGSNKPKFIKLG